jgi:hypothetical protein
VTPGFRPTRIGTAVSTSVLCGRRLPPAVLVPMLLATSTTSLSQHLAPVEVPPQPRPLTPPLYHLPQLPAPRRRRPQRRVRRRRPATALGGGLIAHINHWVFMFVMILSYFTCHYLALTSTPSLTRTPPLFTQSSAP